MSTLNKQIWTDQIQKKLLSSRIFFKLRKGFFAIR